MCIIDNYSHEYKTRRILDLDKILLVRYDKSKKANIGKRRNVYNTNIDSTYVHYPIDVIDYVPDSFHGGIVLSDPCPFL